MQEQVETLVGRQAELTPDEQLMEVVIRVLPNASSDHIPYPGGPDMKRGVFWACSQEMARRLLQRTEINGMPRFEAMGVEAMVKKLATENPGVDLAATLRVDTIPDSHLQVIPDKQKTQMDIMRQTQSLSLTALLERAKAGKVITSEGLNSTVHDMLARGQAVRGSDLIQQQAQDANAAVSESIQRLEKFVMTQFAQMGRKAADETKAAKGDDTGLTAAEQRIMDALDNPTPEKLVTEGLVHPEDIDDPRAKATAKAAEKRRNKKTTQKKSTRSKKSSKSKSPRLGKNRE